MLADKKEEAKEGKMRQKIKAKRKPRRKRTTQTPHGSFYFHLIKEKGLEEKKSKQTNAPGRNRRLGGPRTAKRSQKIRNKVRSSTIAARKEEAEEGKRRTKSKVDRQPRRNLMTWAPHGDFYFHLMTKQKLKVETRRGSRWRNRACYDQQNSRDKIKKIENAIKK